MAQFWMEAVLRKVDRFGHRFEMHYQGHTSYGTTLGGCITILVYVLIAINSVKILTDFINDSNQTEINRILYEDITQQGEVNLYDN